KTLRLRRYAAIAAAFLTIAAASDDVVGRVRAWRAQHEAAILRELFELLAIPNVAANKDDIQRNAATLKAMFERRRFTADILPTSGSPVVLAERRAPGGGRRTMAFYFHYDGQPVDPREWTHGPPFAPVIVVRDGSSERSRPTPQPGETINGEWRVYARSS